MVDPKRNRCIYLVYFLALFSCTTLMISCTESLSFDEKLRQAAVRYIDKENLQEKIKKQLRLKRIHLFIREWSFFSKKADELIIAKASNKPDCYVAQIPFWISGRDSEGTWVRMAGELRLTIAGNNEKDEFTLLSDDFIISQPLTIWRPLKRWAINTFLYPLGFVLFWFFTLFATAHPSYESSKSKTDFSLSGCLMFFFFLMWLFTAIAGAQQAYICFSSILIVVLWLFAVLMVGFLALLRIWVCSTENVRAIGRHYHDWYRY